MVAAGLTVLVALALLLVQHRRYFFTGDTQIAYYGWWYHLGAEVRAGHWPVLDPHAWRAGDLLAEGQWGLYSPLVIGIGLLATAWSSVLGLATAVKLGLACTGALGVFRLVRSYGAPAPAAYVAAVAVPMGGVTQYLDLPSWATGLMIWALLPWVWWALRRTMLTAAGPVAALALGYLLVTVGYVYGTIMLVLVLGACLVDVHLAGDRAAGRRVLAVGVLLGLVATAVYLPGVLTVGVTTRSSGFAGFGGPLTTNPVALFTSVVPTATVHASGAHRFPYTYVAWFLPVLLWLDLGALRRRWRPVAGLVLMTVASFLLVDGPSQLGPLRWPLRLHPFLVQTLVVLVVVALHRFGVRRPSPARLGLSLLWVGLAGAVALARDRGAVTAVLLGVAVAAAGIVAVWLLLRAGRTGLLGGVAAVVTLGALALQHGYYPSLPSPQRNMPAAQSGYRQQLPAARGDVMVVGRPEPELEKHPRWARDFLVGSAWYLNPHRVQNTYSTIGFATYTDRYCIAPQGNACGRALPVLFTREPTTGLRRVDLLGVSTLLLVRNAYPYRALAPPPGWQVAAATMRSVTWVRTKPVPGAGGVVWRSPGTAVTPVSQDDRTVRFRVDRLPAGGGRVVLSRLAWPGYRTDTGRLGARVDGYLLSVDLPPDAVGRVATVRFSPPGWPLELGSWLVAVLAGTTWCVVAAVRRRRVSGAGRWSARRPGPTAG
jgi:hypothetical protein